MTLQINPTTNPAMAQFVAIMQERKGFSQRKTTKLADPAEQLRTAKAVAQRPSKRQSPSQSEFLRETRRKNIKAASEIRTANSAKRINQLQAYIDTVQERPNVTEMAKMFHVARNTVCRMVKARFGEYCSGKIAREWLATQTERPTCRYVAERFGINRDYASIIICEYFSKFDPSAARRAGVEWMVAHPNATRYELMAEFKRSSAWATAVRREAKARLEAVAK